MNPYIFYAIVLLAALGLWSLHAITTMEQHLRDMHEQEVRTQGKTEP